MKTVVLLGDGVMVVSDHRLFTGSKIIAHFTPREALETRDRYVKAGYTDLSHAVPYQKEKIEAIKKTLDQGCIVLFKVVGFWIFKFPVSAIMMKRKEG